jgi:hypothetical protein
MALKLSVLTRNARLDAIETLIGGTAKLSLRTGAPPADCAAGDSGDLLIQITLPADYWNAAASGSKTKLGTWQGVATGPGVAAHFRLYANDGVTCHMQGTVSLTGIGGDLEVDNTNIAVGQTVTITTFTITDANP